MSPRRGHGKPRRVPMDKEAVSAPHVFSPQGDLSVPLEFFIPPISQARPYPPMSFEAFQAFTFYWYAQA